MKRLVLLAVLALAGWTWWSFEQWLRDHPLDYGEEPSTFG